MTERRDVATYSLHEPRSTTPSEYEVVTSRLLYYVGRGFETDVPLRRWYERYQQGSPLSCSDWEAFADPDETTYPKYTRARRQVEHELDALLVALEAGDAEGRPGEPLTERLADVAAPLRFALHGMHMVASYVGQMAPSGRIAMAALFQSADELRRIERIAQGMCAMAQTRKRGFGGDSKAAWQSGPAWQPLREATERLLVAYDFGEALVGLNLCLKPAIDELAGCCLAEECAQGGERYRAALFRHAYEDSLWQQRWTVALLRRALAQNPENRAVIGRWLEVWGPRALLAAESLAELLQDPAAATARVRASHQALVASALRGEDCAR